MKHHWNRTHQTTLLLQRCAKQKRTKQNASETMRKETNQQAAKTINTDQCTKLEGQSRISGRDLCPNTHTHSSSYLSLNHSIVYCAPPTLRTQIVPYEPTGQRVKRATSSPSWNRYRRSPHHCCCPNPRPDTLPPSPGNVSQARDCSGTSKTSCGCNRTSSRTAMVQELAGTATRYV
jgi:hypothetical protein